MSPGCALLATITTISGLRNAVLHDFHSGERFEIRGTVVSARQDHDCNLSITDGSEFVFLSSTNGESAACGDLIVACGHVDLNRDGKPKAYACEIETIGTGRLPEPVAIESDRISDESLFFHSVEMTGQVIDIVPDDIDPRWSFMLLKDRYSTYFAVLPDGPRKKIVARSYIGARVSIVGNVCRSFGGSRHLMVPSILTSGVDSIRILTPPPDDPFDAPHIDVDDYKSFGDLDGSIRRRADGIVLAVWRDDSILIQANDGNLFRAEIASRDNTAARPLPQFGDRVALLGFPRTDLFRINLVRADFRILSKPPTPAGSPTDVSADKLFSGRYGEHQIQPQYHGRLIRISGEAVDVRDQVTTLSCGKHIVTLDASSCKGMNGVARGCKVSATGICVINFENFLPQEPFPRINGITIVPRSADDIEVLSRPPWWTPSRLAALVAALVAFIVAILIWNRILQRMIERRGRAIYRFKIAKAESDLRLDERTRLAVEIHDSISQTLTGVSFQIDAAEKTLGVDDVAATRFLGVAKRTLLSCREELRRCLWDLRNNTLEDEVFAHAIEKTVKPHIGTAKLSVRFDVPRHSISDSTAHTILSIIRELTVNATRHGHAAHVRIAGEKRDDVVRFSVRDDGCGFDPSTRPGPTQGHFGLQGVRERVNKLQGKVKIESAPGQGTKITVEIEE